MKKILCREIGDPNGPMNNCEHEFHAQTFDQLIENVKDHVIRTAEHAEDLKVMEVSTEEQRQAWIAKAKNVWDSKTDE